jgi:hypothetical protein
MLMSKIEEMRGGPGHTFQVVFKARSLHESDEHPSGWLPLCHETNYACALFLCFFIGGRKKS